MSSASVGAYLRERRVIPPRAEPTVRELSGGISNTVLGVEWSGGAVVLKQSLPKLRVAVDWEFDPRRIIAEAECMAALADLVAEGEVPTLLDLDRERLAFTMSHAPTGGTVWKEALLAGTVDAEVARRAGVLLGAIHREAAARARDLAGRFADLMPLLQGRIDPYHRTAARAHPDLAPAIERDIARLTSQRRTLVLGDYSPKNLIVYPDRVLALDFEVAHWGDPAFDTGFMLTHLVAKAIHLPSSATTLLTAARAFWAAYVDAAGEVGAAESDTATELSMLLLCRVDGKSVLEYLTAQERAQTRCLARELIVGGAADLESIFRAVSAVPAAGSDAI